MAETPTRPQRFEDLYRTSRDDVYAFVSGMLRDRAAAEDVTAMAFERAYRRYETFDAARGNERGWLFGIARNAALDELRRRSRHAAMVTEPADDAAGPDDHAELTERRATVRAALATLPEEDRELIVLKFHAGLTNPELAEALGMSVSNVGTKLHRAMDKLRKATHAVTD